MESNLLSVFLAALEFFFLLVFLVLGFYTYFFGNFVILLEFIF